MTRIPEPLLPFLRWASRPGNFIALVIAGVFTSCGVDAMSRASYDESVRYCRSNPDAPKCAAYASDVKKLEVAERREAYLQRQEETSKVRRWFAGDGARYSCEKHLKEQLRDPDSYQSTDEWQEVPGNQGEKVLLWQFRARNGFGGYNLSTGSCVVTTANGGTVKAEILDFVK